MAAKTDDAKIMTSEYIETGQTFSESGAAYCPLERRRRGPAGVAVSIAVLMAGAGFLTFAVLSSPASGPQLAQTSLEPASAPGPDAEAPASEAAIPETTIIEAAAIDPQVFETRAFETGANEPQTADAASIEQAIAESRAARSTGGMPIPSLKKPTAQPATQTADATKPENAEEVERGFWPRLKPQIQQAETKPLVAARPMRLGGLFRASDEDRPGPVFFPSDLERREIIREHAPVALAQDIVRPSEEVRIRISRGENFVDALKRAGVRRVDSNDAAYAFGKLYNLRRLQPGQEFALTLGWPNQTLFQLAAEGSEPEARLLGLEFRIDAENKISMKRNRAGDFDAEKSVIPLTTRTMAIAGVIDGSLYESAKAVGAPDEVIADLADAFSYDVDFQREIFGGDEFEAIFEVRFDDQGRMVGAGDILFARLNWRGRQREKGYYRFAASSDGARGDYYDATGTGAKRLLMKTPIDGARLSSGFGSRRHPILGYRRAHKGVDFAAPRGTPIKAAGDGVIERANRYGSFGNYVRIRHTNGYKTAYAHLKGFARGMRAGKRVRQGDIIGYVGTTGRSTGPHLHYEVHLNGTAINPQKLKIATTKKLKGADLDRFRAQREFINAMRTPEEDPAALYASDEAADENAL